MAAYVIGMTAELHNLGLRMIQDSLEAMDQMLQESPIRLKHWVVESHTTKQLVTSLGTNLKLWDEMQKCILKPQVIA